MWRLLSAGALDQRTGRSGSCPQGGTREPRPPHSRPSPRLGHTRIRLAVGGRLHQREAGHASFGGLLEALALREVRISDLPSQFLSAEIHFWDDALVTILIHNLYVVRVAWDSGQRH